ncbi:MAG TPA: hypothetical protein VGF67_12485 [Ktedonobacteraceae bacterium]
MMLDGCTPGMAWTYSRERASGKRALVTRIGSYGRWQDLFVLQKPSSVLVKHRLAIFRA